MTEDNEIDQEAAAPSGVLERLVSLRKVVNFNWPRTNTNYLCPWYQIAWKLLFWPFLYLGFCISWFCFVMTYGIDFANEWWKKAVN